MKSFSLTYKGYGSHAILIEWPPYIGEGILNDVLLYKKKIKTNLSEVIVDIRTAYNSILAIYKNKITDLNIEIARLESIYVSEFSVKKAQSMLWNIPVCYDEKFGLDLKGISRERKLTIPEIITLHSETLYTVYFIGFLPGFLYLGGLPEAIHTPRKPNPRFHIEKGAVAIGEKQTGVYPCESPGGWNIIGNSPICFFDATRDNPCFAKPGDRIQFFSISLKEHHDIRASIVEGVYQLESEVHGD